MVLADADYDLWKPLKYHEQQKKAYYCKDKFVCIRAGRGSGKTLLARRRCIRELAVKKPWPDPKGFYALPTRDQALRVAWEPLKSLVPENWIDEIYESKLMIRTIFGSTLHLVGADKPQRLEGVQWDFGVIDEACDQKPLLFTKSILPACTHRCSWLWRIGAQYRHGIGANEFNKFFKLGLTGDPIPGTGYTVRSFTWPSSTILDPAELAFAKQNMDERDYMEQFDAVDIDLGGGIFYAFSHKNIIKNDYREDLPIIVGCDFNVDPMCWVLCHRIGNELYVFDEMFIRNTTTDQMLNRLALGQYKDHSSGWVFIGDAASRARKTCASFSDYAQISNFGKDGKLKKVRVEFPKANPQQRNRFSATNAKIKNANGIRSLFIDPRCGNLIDDLNARAYKEGTSEPDDYGDVGHMSDALGYIIHKIWPIKVIIQDHGESKVAMR